MLHCVASMLHCVALCSMPKKRREEEDAATRRHGEPGKDEGIRMKDEPEATAAEIMCDNL